jgi:hypothetical protein
VFELNQKLKIQGMEGEIIGDQLRRLFEAFEGIADSEKLTSRYDFETNILIANKEERTKQLDLL